MNPRSRPVCKSLPPIICWRTGIRTARIVFRIAIKSDATKKTLVTAFISLFKKVSPFDSLPDLPFLPWGHPFIIQPVHFNFQIHSPHPPFGMGALHTDNIPKIFTDMQIELKFNGKRHSVGKFMRTFFGLPRHTNRFSWPEIPEVVFHYEYLRLCKLKMNGHNEMRS